MSHENVEKHLTLRNKCFILSKKIYLKFNYILIYCAVSNLKKMSKNVERKNIKTKKTLDI